MQPQTIDHFIGQQDVVRRIRVALEAAWNDGTRLPHMLMVGPPGVGKTTVAQIIAKEMGVTLHEMIGQAVACSDALNGLLMDAKDKDVVFLDEAHELHPRGQTALYRAMEDRVLFLSSFSEKTLPVPVDDFTLIAATTDAYSLLEPLRQRFQLILPFQFYDVESLTKITAQRAKQMGLTLNPDVAQGIAKRSKGTPRIAVRLLQSCHRYARSKGDHEITVQHFHETVALEGLDELGLDRDEQRYLRLLAENPGEPVRLYTIEAALGIHHWTLQQVIEPYLVRARLIERDESGRRLTPQGMEHLKPPKPVVTTESDIPF